MANPHLTLPSQPSASIVASPWIERYGHLLRPGSRVLDVACGSGRHMRWLHDHGLQALGVDRDAQAGVDLQALGLEFLLADLEQEPWPFAPQSMDAVLVTHYLWRPLWSDLKAVLKPHGLLIYETFSSGHEALGRPKNPDFLLRPGELLEVFADFHIIAFEEGLEPHPPRLLQRLVAQKPMSFTERPATALRSLE